MSQGARVSAVVGTVLCLYTSLMFAQTAASAQAAPAVAGQVTSALYASVNGKAVTQAEFQDAYVNYIRQKFYHGQVPEAQLLQARKDVGGQLIEQILLLEEADRRAIQADSADVEKQIKEYDLRYANNPNWQQSRETMLPGLRRHLEQKSRLQRLEQAVRDVPPPGPEQVKAFFAAKPELFTEPAKLRMHAILLGVAPASPQSVWEAARLEGEAIVRRIRGGADFAEQARLASNDGSGEKGGDMGYLHQGMIPESLQAKVDAFKIGEVNDPIVMLEGIGIFRLDERVPAKLRDYAAVAERAKELLYRELKERAWTDFIAKLKADASIVIFEAPAGTAPGAK